MSIKRFRLLLLLVFCFSLAAQSPMNNEGVVKLVKSGMTEDLILNVIQQQPGSYTFGAEDLVALKDSGSFGKNHRRHARQEQRPVRNRRARYRPCRHRCRPPAFLHLRTGNLL